jgi:hypothetical protein
MRKGAMTTTTLTLPLHRGRHWRRALDGACDLAAFIHRLMPPLQFLVAIWLIGAATAHAATITATTCSASNVQSSLNAAANGDTVVIPNGSCTWTTGVTTSKQVIITGQSKGSVIITHGAGAVNLFSITTGFAFSTEIRNITFLVSSGDGGRYLDIGGDGKVPLVHDNYFRVPDFVLIHAIRLSRSGGIFWNNTFESLDATGTSGSSGSGSGVFQLNNDSGGSSWTTASTMGKADTTGTANTYIEDNTFSNLHQQAIDIDNNARAVIRHNILNDSTIVSHGADTSTDGARHVEVYDNIFVFHASGSNGPITYPLAVNRWWYIRGGTGLITDNVIPDITSPMWGPKEEFVFTVQNLRRDAGPNPCRTSYPAPHQVGQSHDGSAPITEPLYIWNNTGFQNPGDEDYSPNECGPGAPTTSSFVQPGRDYVVGSPKPGYTKYSYPHPLRGGVGIPSAPQNLRIIR